MIVIMDKNDNNEFCDIDSNKCIKFSEDYRTHDITVLDDFVIAVGLDKSAISDQ